MRSNSYDAIVLGDDLSTGVTAALCARRGLRTLWLTHDARPARYALGPHRLPVEPMLWPTLAGHAGERVARELAIDLALKRRHRDARVVVQLLGPDLRLDLTADAPLWERELSRELGADAAAVAQAWAVATTTATSLDALGAGDHAFPGTGFWERRDAKKQLDALSRAAGELDTAMARVPAPLRVVLEATSTVGARAGEARALSSARAMAALRGGVVPLRGDGDALRELVVEKFTAAGGEVRDAAAAELVSGWSKLTSVRLANGEELGCGQVVTSLSPTALVGMLGKKPPKELVQLATAGDLIGYRYTLNLVIDQAGVPEGMAPVVLVVLDPSKAPLGANAFSIHLGEPDDAGRVVVTLAALLPAGAPLDDDTLRVELAALRKALLARLDLVMPFYGRHAILLHSPHEADLPEVPGGHGGHDVPRAFPCAMRPVWRAGLEDGAGLAALPYGTGIKNLSLVGLQILPGLGVEGELLAGWNAARLACAIAGKKKDYLRDEVVGAAG